MENQYFKEPNEIYAILMGVLSANNNGKIQVTKLNKLADSVGLDKVSTIEMKDLFDYYQSEQYYYELMEDAFNGTLTLDNIQNPQSDKKPYEDGTHNYESVVTPYISQRQKMQDKAREINAVVREGSRIESVLQEIKESLDEKYGDQVATLNSKPLNLRHEDGGTLYVTLADLHVGAVVKPEVGWGSRGYNYNILLDRLQTYKEYIHEYFTTTKVNTIKLLVLGDIVENTNMRKHQSFETEFIFSEQITHAYFAIQDFIAFLDTLAPTKVYVTNGNHGRFQANKKEKLYNDSAERVVLDLLLHDVERGVYTQTQVHDNRETLNVFMDTDEFGKTFVGTHGDYIRAKSGSKINSLNAGKPIDLLFTGHKHYSEQVQELGGSMAIQVGSTMGSNSYAKENFYGETQPSQTLVCTDQTDNIATKVIFFE